MARRIAWRRKPMRRLIATLVVLGLPALLLLGVFENRGVDSRRASYRLELSDYDRVPLPIDEPPPALRVRAGHEAGSGAGAQHIRFEYRGYAVSACTRPVRAVTSDPCAFGPGTVFRRFRSGHWLTVYAASTTSRGPVTDPDDLRTLAFFESADLVVRPYWMPWYVEETINQKFG